MTSEKRKRILFNQTYTCMTEFNFLKNNASNIDDTYLISVQSEYYALRTLIVLLDLDYEYNEWFFKERNNENG